MFLDNVEILLTTAFKNSETELTKAPVCSFKRFKWKSAKLTALRYRTPRCQHESPMGTVSGAHSRVDKRIEKMQLAGIYCSGNQFLSLCDLPCLL